VAGLSQTNSFTSNPPKPERNWQSHRLRGNINDQKKRSPSELHIEMNIVDNPTLPVVTAH